MSIRKRTLALIMALFLGLLAACQSGTDGPDQAASLQELTPTQVEASATPVPLPPTLTPTPLIPTPSPTPELPCSEQSCAYYGHFWLGRPILPGDNDNIDSTYRYGSTQEGARPTHHGVEFVNPEGTPVLAAAEGLVIVAGTDFQQTYADYPYYYGNLVIIEHQFPEVDVPVFTLYGHLSAVQTQVGAYVQAGDQIGAVGYTGVAEWSHLHFEVRVGENTYRHTRNPELWLRPHSDENGVANAALGGRILDEYGTPIYIPNVVVERLGPDSQVVETIYVETYADFSMNGDDQWGENFAIGDLPPGSYRVGLVAYGLQTWEIELLPGTLTILTFDARQP
jgi:murein DD-endopeptidase MepM/ murein hydrolase activator NlpD